MAELPRLRVGLTLDSATFIRETKNVAASVDRLGNQLRSQNATMARSFDQVERGIGRVVAGFRTLGAIVGLGSLTALARQVIQTADAYTALSGRLRLVTGSAQESDQILQRLIQTANATHSSVADLAKLYTRLALTAGEAGVSSEQLLAITEVVAQAVKIGGSNAQEASAGLLQFAQAMGSGVLRGDELRSVLEQVPGLAIALSRGLDKPISQFKALGEAGFFSTTRVLNALLKEAPRIAEEYRKLPLQVADAFQILRNNLFALVGDSDQATESSRRLAGAIEDIADVIGSAEFRSSFQTFLTDFLDEAAKRIRSTREEWDKLIQLFDSASGFLSQFGLGTPQTIEQITSRITFLRSEIERLNEQADLLVERGYVNPGDAEKVAVATSIIQAHRAEIEKLYKSINPVIEAEKQLAESIAKPPTTIDIRGETAVDPALAKRREQTRKQLIEEIAGLTRLNAITDQNAEAVRNVGIAIEAKQVLSRLELKDTDALGKSLTKLVEQRERERDINKQLGELKGITDRTQLLNLEIAAQGRITEETRIQLELEKQRQKFGEAAAKTAESRIRAEQHAISIRQQGDILADLEDQIVKQQMLLQAQGKETENYRVQVRLLELRRQGQDITPEIRRNVELLERQATQLENIADVQESLAKSLQNAFETAWENIQNLSTETFEKIYRGGITTFGDLAEAIKDIFIRLAAEVSTLLVFRAATESTAGAISATGSLAQALGFAPAAAGGVGPGGGPGGGPIGGPGRAPTTAGLPGTAGFAALNQAPWWRSADWWTTPQQGLGPMLLSGALGFAGGGLIGGRFGGQGQLGGGLGGGLGAAAGLAFGGPAGALAGGLLGGLGGGFLGGLFGGEEENTGKLRFRSRGAIGGPFGGIDISGEESFAGPLTALVKQFDEGVAQFLTARQESRITKTLQALDRYSERLPEADPSKGFEKILRQRAKVVLREAGLSTRILKGAGVEEIGQRVGTALQTQATIKELLAANDATAQFAKQIADIREQFATLTRTAQQYGISTRGLALAQWEAIQAIKAQEKAQKAQVQRSVTEAVGGNTLALTIADIKARFAELTAVAKEWGVSTKGLARAQWDAVQAAKAQAREQINVLALGVIAPFEQLLAPLEAFQQQLKFADLNPAQQLAAAKKDFERIANLARAGSTIAIDQLASAGELFIRLSEQVGASPGGAAAREEVSSVIESVIKDINKAQKEASKGLEDVIKRASIAQIDTLKELKAEVVKVAEEIKRLKH